MEEIVVLSSDSSNPPSPEVKEESDEKLLECAPLVCNENQDASSRDILNTSVYKRPAYHNISSSDESDASLPVPPFDEMIPSKQSKLSNDHDSNSSDIEEVITAETGSNVPNIHYSSLKFNNFLNEDNGNSKRETETKTNNVLDKLEESLDSDSRKMSENRETEKKSDLNTYQRQKEDRAKKNQEKLQEKALKKKFSAAVKAKRPGQCHKYIRTLLDQRLLTEEYGGDILVSLRNSEMIYEIQSQVCANTISWVKFSSDFLCDDEMKLTASTNVKEEPIVLVVMKANEVIDLVQQNKLRNFIRNISSLHVNKKITVVIYQLLEYIRLQNLEKQRRFKAQCHGQPKTVSNGGYKVSHEDIEKALIEIQIFENCSHRMVETSQEVGSFIAEYTKALAEKEFKLEKQQLQDTLEWFAAGDSRDTIKVDKNSNGLSRLWKQQMCQFTKCSIDAAESIISIYPSPVSLMEAYKNCSTPTEGEKLLQDVSIRRGTGPLTSIRRVGPEISRQMFKFFTALNGDLPLSQD